MKRQYLFLFGLSMLLASTLFSQTFDMTRLTSDIPGASTQRFIPTIYSTGLTTDVRVYPSSDYDQSEISISINPFSLNNLLVGANTKKINGVDEEFYQGYYFSLDNGLSWTGDNKLPGQGSLSSDPSVAFDADGNAFLTSLKKTHI